MFILPDEDAVHELHECVLQETGGELGIHDENGLASALHRPDDRMYYQPESTLAEVAACCAYGLAINHAFRDGNKRTSLAATDVMLNLNGFEISAHADAKERAWLLMGAGRWDEARLADWLDRHLSAIDLLEDDEAEWEVPA